MTNLYQSGDITLLKNCLLLKCHFRDTFNGGPVHWIHENYVCPNCVKSPDNGCCKNVPEGQFCKADTINIEEDPNVSTYLRLRVCIKS